MEGKERKIGMQRNFFSCVLNFWKILNFLFLSCSIADFGAFLNDGKTLKIFTTKFIAKLFTVRVKKNLRKII